MHGRYEMARIRTIKPNMGESVTLAKVSFAARYFFCLLLCHLDDEGRIKYFPKKLAGEMYAQDDEVSTSTIRGWVEECTNAGLLVAYASGDANYLYSPTFLTHQKIDKPSPSRCPEPPEIEPTYDNSTNTPRILDEDSENPRRLEIGNRKEEIGNRKEEDNSFVGLDPTACVDLDPEAEKKAAKDKKKADAEALSGILVAYLNEIGGRKYSPDAAKKLCTRFKDAKKADWERIEAEARLIVEFKASQWLNDPEMKRNIAPETVWAPSHWPSYLSEANEWLESGKANTNAPLDIMAIAKQMAMAANQ